MSPRVVLVTGGSRGIGAATARLASERGDTVVINYARDSARADAFVAELGARGARVSAVRADVSREDEVLRLFETVDREHGRLDVLVNNAGIVLPQSRVEAMTAERLTQMFAVNVIGSVLCAREAVRRMSRRHGGRGGAIVNVSSVAARLGAPEEYVDYAASKAAIDTLTIGLAKEVARDGIRVNAVRPGTIDTEIHASGGDPNRAHRLGPSMPFGRPGTADEIAEAILWLASAEASYTSGAILDVAGAR